jgi:hypothetical protein
VVPAAYAAGTTRALVVTLNGRPVSTAPLLSGPSGPLPFDVPYGTQYVYCGDAGFKAFDGWSITKVLNAVGIDPAVTSSVTVRIKPAAPGEQPVTLKPPDFDPTTPGGLDFVPGLSDPLAPAVVEPFDIAGTQEFSFYRPLRIGTTCADGGVDLLQPLTAGTTLKIQVTAGTQLNVTASATKSATTAGVPDTFTSTVMNPPIGVQLTYQWAFDDATSATGQSVAHSFASPGTYHAQVSVLGSDRSAGVSNTITIVVGKAPGLPGHATTTTSAPPTEGGPHGGGPTGSRGPAPTGTPTTTTTTTTSATTTTTRALPPAEVPSSTPPPSVAPVTPAAGSPAASVTTTTTVPRRTFMAKPDEIRVTGYLISGANPPTAESATSSHPAARALGPDGGLNSTAVWRWLRLALVIAVPLGLLSGGVLSELGGRRRVQFVHRRTRGMAS